MLFSILLFGTIATLGSTLPSAPGPAPLPSFLPIPAGSKPNFRLIERHTESEHVKDYWTSCWNDDLTPTPKEANWQGNMLKCLDQYDRPDWEGQDCGGVGWYKASINYQNPQNCFDACRGCFDWFIDSNSTNGYCWTNHGATTPNYDGGAPIDVKRSTACNMGYH